MGKYLGESLLDLLCAETGITDFRIAALWIRTDPWNRFSVATDMAGKFLIRTMVGERNAAVWTTRHKAAERALQRRGIASAIEKQDGLFASLNPVSDSIRELWGKNRDDFSLA